MNTTRSLILHQLLVSKLLTALSDAVLQKNGLRESYFIVYRTLTGPSGPAGGY